MGDGEFAVALFPAVGAHGEGLAVRVVAEGDECAEAAFSAEILAVDGEGFGQKVAVGDEPGVDGASEGVGIDLVDDVVEGIVAGHEELAALEVAAGQAEGGALLLVERSAFAPDGFHVGRTAE